MSEKEIVEKKCESCGKTMYVQKEFIRDKMYCTLGCMNPKDDIFIRNK